LGAACLHAHTLRLWDPTPVAEDQQQYNWQVLGAANLHQYTALLRSIGGFRLVEVPAYFSREGKAAVDCLRLPVVQVCTVITINYSHGQTKFSFHTSEPPTFGIMIIIICVLV
jgi:hypothetical protein